MTDLLLITDVPRLRKIFSRLTDNRDIRLRIVNNLEKGGEELVADKPGIVFVQTHLSGLSAEIILMHLKKQLGRKRTRFVLLSNPAQTGSETVRLYQGHIDTSLDDEVLLTSIKDMIATLLAKAQKKVEVDTTVADTVPAEPQPPQTEPPMEDTSAIASPPQESYTPPPPLTEEPSLVEQGVTYAPRPRMIIHSEFNSSFDSAVSSMKPAAELSESTPEHHHAWNDDEIETIEPSAKRSKLATFILWLAPVVIGVVVITMVQHMRSAPSPSGVSLQVQTAASSLQVPQTAPASQKAQPAAPAAPVAPLQAQKQPVARPATEPESPLSDKAVLSAIAENRGNKNQATPSSGSSRPTVLPDFIPRSALDKAYTKANPGWERYKGYVTEFKVYRVGNAIKAIQVIDRGGNGVPESFMKAALRQVSKTPAFVLESSEKKEGYEIQRGHVAENLKVMYYRDEQGGKLRAFVLTWH